MQRERTELTARSDHREHREQREQREQRVQSVRQAPKDLSGRKVRPGSQVRTELTGPSDLKVQWDP